MIGMAFRTGIVMITLLSLLAVTSRTSADTITDRGLWFMAAGQGDARPLGDRWRKVRWWLDVQPRLSDAAGGLQQILVRPGLGYSIAGNASAWLGYAWIRTEGNGKHVTENRIWQQFTWSPRIEWLGLSSRTRLEQRFVDQSGDLGWRFRQFIKVTQPIAAGKRLYLSVFDEIFFDLNDTDWGQQSGFAQNRMFAGVGWKLFASGKLSTEIGYLNQFVRSGSGSNRMNHILSINLFVNP